MVGSQQKSLRLSLSFRLFGNVVADELTVGVATLVDTGCSICSHGPVLPWPLYVDSGALLSGAFRDPIADHGPGSLRRHG